MARFEPHSWMDPEVLALQKDIIRIQRHIFEIQREIIELKREMMREELDVDTLVGGILFSSPPGEGHASAQLPNELGWCDETPRANNVSE